ncbi:MAG: endo-1,4-beta-xylanase, partial [candidate division KSB1 bacterium]|nr:endo-1,4-beta-xylanase [candidate division KSB1 bacterium]
GRSFNMVVFENALKWDAWESDWEGTKKDVVDVIRWLRNNDIRIRGHCLVWPGPDWLPSRIVNNINNLNYVRNEIRNHIFDVAGYPGVKGNIEEWDVINEMVHNKYLENAFGTQDIYKEWLEWAHEADPNAVLYLNEYSILSSEGLDTATQQAYKALLKKLVDAGAPIGGLGMQTHVGSNLTPPTRVLQILDYFAELGLHMSITEYDAAGAHPDIAGDYMRDILICAFSHPAMKNFLMWGFWDGSHWLNDAPIFNRDWSLKPSGRSYIEWVFYRWWTNAEGVTDDGGNFTTRAFYGDYEIHVEAAGAKSYKAEKFNRSTGEIVMQLDTEATEVKSSELPSRFQVLPAYPNPFNSETVIGYVLPRTGHVFLQLYDLSGRKVRTLVDEPQNAGEHKFRFSADSLPSGIYVYVLSFEQEKYFGKLTLLR